MYLFYDSMTRELPLSRMRSLCSAVCAFYPCLEAFAAGCIASLNRQVHR